MTNTITGTWRKTSPLPPPSGTAAHARQLSAGGEGQGEGGMAAAAATTPLTPDPSPPPLFVRERLNRRWAGERGAVFTLTLLAMLAFAGTTSAQPKNVHEQLLDEAAGQQAERRERFATVRTKAALQDLQSSLRAKFLALLDGLPQSKGPPPVQVTGMIDAGDYVIDKLVFESFPGYFVSALLYKPRKAAGPAPGIISPCGHSAVGKAAAAYQTLH